jgi:hypothetical protein
VVWVLTELGLIPALPDYLQFWLLMALGAAIFLPATLLSRPESMDRLVHYYAMTRPIGWWGPVHREAVRRGLVAPEEPIESASRPLIRRSWTPEQADHWTREDWIAIVLSPLIFAGMMIGLTKLLILQWTGLWFLILSVLAMGLLYWVIDPKMRAVSHEYEEQQQRYLERLEQSMRWQGAAGEREG